MDNPNDRDGGPVFEDYPVDQSSCKLLGPTALIVQGLMGVIVIASLVYKRHRETPKRPWRIWLFDVSKQIVGQMFVHGTNVLISDLGSHQTSGNACVYYFLNILLDTTFGVGIIYFIIHFATWVLAERLLLKGFESGQYGNPPSIIYWFRQAAVYVFALTSMKLVVIALFALWPGIFEIGGWLLGFLGSSEAMQVIFVMGLFPIFMNVLQFWLIDSIVKASADPDGLSLPSSLYDTDAAEPLFHHEASDTEDEDGSPSRLPDIEAQRRPGRSRSHSRSSDHMRMSRRSSNDMPTTHAYPPSITGSPKLSSSRPTSTSPTGGLGGSRRRRSPPPPLLPRSPMVPAINAAEPEPPLLSSAANVVGVAKGELETEDWNNWDKGDADEDDWAERVGEEEWTGKRMAAKKGEVDGVWKDS